jgi:hypothetical protein
MLSALTIFKGDKTLGKIKTKAIKIVNNCLIDFLLTKKSSSLNNRRKEYSHLLQNALVN